MRNNDETRGGLRAIFCLVVVAVSVLGCAMVDVALEATSSPLPSASPPGAQVLATPSITEGDVATDSVSPGWLYEGAIYEVPPYYYGGAFDGITENIPRIAALGVKALYMMPVFAQPEGFPEEMARHCRNIYRIPDLAQIDPVYGTPEDLKELVRTAHEHGLKVLFDLVLNNTPQDREVPPKICTTWSCFYCDPLEVF